MDYYRYGGDSLQGRYFFYRLYPFSVKELDIKNNDELEKLLILGGFPEPYLSNSKIEAKRWSENYRDRVVYEEIRDFERYIKNGIIAVKVTGINRFSSLYQLNPSRKICKFLIKQFQGIFLFLKDCI